MSVVEWGTLTDSGARPYQPPNRSPVGSNRKARRAMAAARRRNAGKKA